MSAAEKPPSEAMQDTIDALRSMANACGVPAKIGKKIVTDVDSGVVTMFLVVPFASAPFGGRIKSLPDLKGLVKAAFLND